MEQREFAKNEQSESNKNQNLGKKSILKKMSEKMMSYFESSEKDLGARSIVNGSERNRETAISHKQAVHSQKVEKNLGATSIVNGSERNRETAISHKQAVHSQKVEKYLGATSIVNGKEQNHDNGFGRSAKNMGREKEQNKDGRIGNRETAISHKMAGHSQNVAKNIGARDIVNGKEQNDDNGFVKKETAAQTKIKSDYRNPEGSAKNIGAPSSEKSVKEEKTERNSQERNQARRQHMMQQMGGRDY
ncbi:hypothetical protein [Bacillus cereus]|uniref:hypothetical protein n=1 Tax=Bacillus cereus TaxID=1396 RepID=UPI000300EEDC|nr:hypothetical protein [Bacillus cereus]